MLINQHGIHYRKWQVKKPKAVFLAVHGMGASSGRWEEMVKFFKPKKIGLYAIELKGFGDLAGSNPGHVPDMAMYNLDIATLKDIIMKENPKAPVLMIGESMGAVIAHTHMTDFDPVFAGVVEVVPVYNDVMAISIGKKVVIALTALFSPSKPIAMPFKSEELSRDLKIVEKLKKDKREHRFASAGLLLGMLQRQLKVIFNPGLMKTPCLMLLAGQDKLNDTRFAAKLFEKFKCEKKMILYQDAYHALTIEKNRKEIYADIFKWVTGRLKG